MDENNLQKAALVLEDGTLFHGTSWGCEGSVCGEIVFNTSPTGYQEICTDPSYSNQIVLFTTAHIGNVGINDDDNESGKVQIKGLIVRKMSKVSSNWRSTQSFASFLQEHQTPWIEGIDTRKLTRHLRENGVKIGCIMVGNIDINNAQRMAKKYSAQKIHLPYQGIERNEKREFGAKRIAVIDFGVKANILKTLTEAECEIMIFPSTSSAEYVLSHKPDGILLSNGPGDPSTMLDAILLTRKLIESGIPIFGICLGCQLIALASGGKTIAMKYGHHGTNHPVYDVSTHEVSITSQNHLYVIDDMTLPQNCIVTHRSIFDQTVQGIKLIGLPVMGFQGHPEGSPGPQDLAKMFTQFLAIFNTGAQRYRETC